MGLTKRNSNWLNRLGFGLRDTPTASAGGFVVDVSFWGADPVSATFFPFMVITTAAPVVP
jgi:hypothetical protein